MAVPAGQAGVISSGGLFWFPGLDAVHNRCAPTALVAPEGHVPGRMDPSLGQRFVGGWQQAATPLDPRIQALPLSSPWAHQLQYADPPLGRQTQLENLRWQARVTQDPNTNGHRHLVQHSNNETLSHQPSTYTALQPSVYAAHGQAALPQVQQRVRSGPVISPGDRGYQAGAQGILYSLRTRSVRLPEPRCLCCACRQALLGRAAGVCERAGLEGVL